VYCNRDNFHYNEIWREPGKDDFIEATKEEIANHNDNVNWIPVLQSSLPASTKVIPSIGDMGCKQQLLDGKMHTQMVANKLMG
jgi:hypothetical protein